MRTTLALVPLLVLGCRSEGTLTRTPPDLSIVVDSPTYGEFLGSGPIRVTGRVSHPLARVTVDGAPADVRSDGTFTAELPFEDRYRVLDVEADLYEVHVRERVPVFDGAHPNDTWPGGLTLRLTPAGLDRIGETLGAQIDSLGWSEAILGALPPLQTGWLDVTPTGLSHAPTVVDLAPVHGGIDTSVVLSDVTVDADVDLTWQGVPFTVPVSLGFEEVRVGALAVPAVDDQGLLSLTLTQAYVDMGDPIVDVWISGLEFLELLLQGLAFVVEPLGDMILGVLLDQFGTIPLGGPYAFDTELMGTAMSARLSSVYGDPDGLGAGVGLAFDAPVAAGPLDVPAPVDHAPDVHAALGLHESVLQRIIDGTGLLDMLSQDLELGGAFGNIVGNGITALPGGDDAPDGDGWCLSIDPGTAQVVRLQQGIAPMATLYLPDVLVDVGIMDGADCEPWLLASVVMKVGLEVRGGTEVGMDIAVPEGAVLAYGADPGWDEAEVIEGLGGFVESSVGLLGGQLSFDLADMAGGGLGIPGADGLSPRIVDAYPLLDPETGEHPEGLYTVALGLWE